MLKSPQIEFRPLSCAISGIEPVFARSTRTFARHFHDQFGIGVILSGAQRSASGRGPVEAVQGDVITVNPGEVHDGAPIGGQTRTWAMLYIDPGQIAEIALDLSEGRSTELELAHPVRTDPAAASLFRGLFRSLVRGQDLVATAERLILLANLLAVSGEKPPTRNDVPLWLCRAIQAIDDDPTAPHMLENLASVARIGRFQLIRAFAAHTGMTPHAYIVQRRLQVVRQLLRRGLPLAHVSAEAGLPTKAT